MKCADLNQVIRATPRIVAMFRVTKVPSWAAGYIAKGDEVFWSSTYQSMRTVQVAQGRLQRMNLDLGASYLEFVDYVKIERG
jgi:hypothetical protein